MQECARGGYRAGLFIYVPTRLPGRMETGLHCSDIIESENTAGLVFCLLFTSAQTGRLTAQPVGRYRNNRNVQQLTSRVENRPLLFPDLAGEKLYVFWRCSHWLQEAVQRAVAAATRPEPMHRP